MRDELPLARTGLYLSRDSHRVGSRIRRRWNCARMHAPYTQLFVMISRHANRSPRQRVAIVMRSPRCRSQSACLESRRRMSARYVERPANAPSWRLRRRPPISPADVTVVVSTSDAHEAANGPHCVATARSSEQLRCGRKEAIVVLGASGKKGRESESAAAAADNEAEPEFYL